MAALSMGRRSPCAHRHTSREQGAGSRERGTRPFEQRHQCPGCRDAPCPEPVPRGTLGNSGPCGQRARKRAGIVAVVGRVDLVPVSVRRRGGRTGGERSTKSPFHRTDAGCSRSARREAAPSPHFPRPMAMPARGFFDRWFADHGWTPATGWQSFAGGWYARFETHSPARAVDIRLGTDAQGQWTGLVVESQVEQWKELRCMGGTE